MDRRIVRTAAASLLLYAGATFAASTGPAPSRTGAPAIGGKSGESLCTQCHSLNPANDAGGMVEILDLPASYQPGQAYPMRVRVTSTANEGYEGRKWGFQLTAVYEANGIGSGTWIIPEAPQTDSLRRSTPPSGTFISRVYISHTSPSTRKGEPGPAEWAFSWVAPPVDSGTVIFCAAGNAADGDSLASGSEDWIYTALDTVLAPSAVADVPPASGGPLRTALAMPHPNPMATLGIIGFSLAHDGHAELAIYDASGRRTRTLVREWIATGPHHASWDGRRDDGTAAPNGVYFVRLQAPGGVRPEARRLILAR